MAHLKVEYRVGYTDHGKDGSKFYGVQLREYNSCEYGVSDGILVVIDNADKIKHYYPLTSVIKFWELPDGNA